MTERERLCALPVTFFREILMSRTEHSPSVRVILILGMLFYLDEISRCYLKENASKPSFCFTLFDVFQNEYTMWVSNDVQQFLHSLKQT